MRSTGWEICCAVLVGGAWCRFTLLLLLPASVAVPAPVPGRRCAANASRIVGGMGWGVAAWNGAWACCM